MTAEAPAWTEEREARLRETRVTDTSPTGVPLRVVREDDFTALLAELSRRGERIKALKTKLAKRDREVTRLVAALKPTDPGPLASPPPPATGEGEREPTETAGRTDPEPVSQRASGASLANAEGEAGAAVSPSTPQGKSGGNAWADTPRERLERRLDQHVKEAAERVGKRVSEAMKKNATLPPADVDALVEEAMQAARFYVARYSVDEQKRVPSLKEMSRREALEQADLLRRLAAALQARRPGVDKVVGLIADQDLAVAKRLSELPEAIKRGGDFQSPQPQSPYELARAICALYGDEHAE